MGLFMFGLVFFFVLRINLFL